MQLFLFRSDTVTLIKSINNDKPIRIAQIVGKMNNAGVETVVMNYYRNIDRSKVQFDFFIDSDSKHPPIEEIKMLGGRAYIVSPYKNLLGYIIQVYRILRTNKYKIVHSHLNTISVFPLMAAFFAGARIRIAHNHSTAVKGEPKTILKKMLKPFAKVFATHYFACSEHAGRWLFGNDCVEEGKVTTIKNALELNKFKFSKSIRHSVRSELGIDNKFVIGHVGRIVYPKNHDFLIDIFEQIYLRDKNTMLLLVGEGNLKDNILKKIKIRNLENAVVFLGVIDKIASIYQAIDAFVLPSLYEGFGMVGIEAQAAGIKLFCSEAVPEEVKVSDLVEFISLEMPAAYWAQRILQCINIEYERLEYNEQVGRAGYDIETEAVKLCECYIDLNKI
jgi:glycosyltransferase EpsF